MIRSFADRDTERLFDRHRVRKFSAIAEVAYKKLLRVDAATSLDDLRIPPGNRLHKLSGDRKEQYAIRINDQYRVCFTWQDGAASDVEVTDYHE